MKISVAKSDYFMQRARQCCVSHAKASARKQTDIEDNYFSPRFLDAYIMSATALEAFINERISIIHHHFDDILNGSFHILLLVHFLDPCKLFRRNELESSPDKNGLVELTRAPPSPAIDTLISNTGIYELDLNFLTKRRILSFIICFVP